MKEHNLYALLIKRVDFYFPNFLYKSIRRVWAGRVPEMRHRHRGSSLNKSGITILKRLFVSMTNFFKNQSKEISTNSLLINDVNSIYWKVILKALKKTWTIDCFFSFFLPSFFTLFSYFYIYPYPYSLFSTYEISENLFPNINVLHT